MGKSANDTLPPGAPPCPTFGHLERALVCYSDHPFPPQHERDKQAGIPIPIRMGVVKAVQQVAYSVQIGEQIEHSAQVIAYAFNRTDRIVVDAIRDSLAPWEGRTIDHYERVAGWLCGNFHKLLQGRKANLWGPSNPMEWMAVQVIGIARRSWLTYTKEHPKGSRESGWRLALKVLGGSLCPATVKVFWSYPFVSYAAREIGFSRRDKKKRLEDGMELFGMRFAALMEPGREGKPRIVSGGLRCPTALKSRNTKLSRMRKRIEVECPFNYDHPCYQCGIGSGSCNMATHDYTFVTLICSRCEKLGIADPDPDFGSGSLCMDCMSKEIEA